MTESAAQCDKHEQYPPVRRRKYHAGRVLLVVTVMTIVFFTLFWLIYTFAIERENNAPGEPRERSVRTAISRGTPDELRELLKSNPETRDFVKDYDAERVPLEEIDISGDVKNGEIPLFLQWDKRWGYDNYGSGMLAITGCGPTCLSMVAVALTGDLSLNPRAVADFAAENGYYAAGVGTSWTLMTDGAAQLGLSSRVIPLFEPTILSELRDGSPIICSVGSGDFTQDGHYIVLTGLNSDGTVAVNDPNSIIRSEKDWELAKIMEQVKNLWVFS